MLCPGLGTADAVIEESNLTRGENTGSPHPHGLQAYQRKAPVVDTVGATASTGKVGSEELVTATNTPAG